MTYLTAAEMFAPKPEVPEPEDERIAREATYEMRRCEAELRDAMGACRRTRRIERRQRAAIWHLDRGERRAAKRRAANQRHLDKLAAAANAEKSAKAKAAEPFVKRMRGYASPGIITSTRVAACLVLADTPKALDTRGPKLGYNTETGEAFRYDAFTMYGGALTSANAVVLGITGYGKSLITKIHALRQVMRKRQIAVISPKREWHKLAVAMGWTEVVFDHTGKVRINPMDQKMGRRTINGETVEGMEQIDQLAIMEAIATTAHGAPLNSLEREALSLAIEHCNTIFDQKWTRASLLAAYAANAALIQKRLRAVLRIVQADPYTEVNASALLTTIRSRADVAVKVERLIELLDDDTLAEVSAEYRENTRPGDPIVGDVVTAMLQPTEEAAAEAHVASRDVLREYGRQIAYDLRAIIRSQIGHVINGQTSETFNIDEPALIFDVSQLDKNSKVLPIVMALIGAYLSKSWLRQDGVKRILIVEEGWAVISNLGTAQILQSLCKLHRDLGLSVWTVLHHLGDVQDGEQNDRLAAVQALVNEADTLVIFRQKARHLTALAEVTDLPPNKLHVIATLPQYHAVWKIANQTRIVKGVYSDEERDLIFTNDSMVDQDTGRSNDAYAEKVARSVAALLEESAAADNASENAA